MGKIAKSMQKLLLQTIQEKVVPFEALVESERKAQENVASMRSFQELCEEGYDPTHALYIATQNLVSCFGEEASVLPPLHAWNDFALEVEKTYMPGYPPMSPITKSYSFPWKFFDVGFGEEQETLGSVMITLGPEIGVSPLQLEAIKKLSASRMGIYEVTHVAGKRHEFTELITNKKYQAMVASGYVGNLGDLVYIRLLPPPIEGAIDYYVTMNTPYVLLGTTKKDWIEFFERNQIKNIHVGYESRLYKFLKHGKSQKFWIEFVFEAYLNYMQDRIFLVGIPDRPETLPHSDRFDLSGVNQRMIFHQLERAGFNSGPFNHELDY
jgi:hypothetical protein